MDNSAKVAKVHPVSQKQAMELTTLFTGRNTIRLDTIDSTNRYMSKLIKTSPPEGTIVVTDYQTQGKGQAAKYWHSESKLNLLMTLFWKPTFMHGNEVLKLSYAIAVAVKDTLESFGIESRIKLPNDIYVGDKKIAGILIENVLRGSQMQHSVIGIGLNVNQVSFPAELPNPISMTNLTGKSYDVNEVMYALCNYLEKQYFKLKHGV